MSIEWKDALRFFLGRFATKQRGLALNTRLAYTTTLKLFVEYLKRSGSLIQPCRTEIKSVFGFLESLEKTRGNKIRSRNSRLGALNSFWKALRLVDPGCNATYDQLCSVPSKRSFHDSPDYLEMEELRAVLKFIDSAPSNGFRNMVLLRTMYNIGARTSEICDLRLSHLFLDDRREVHVRGKGGKLRVVPLWKTTVELLRIYIQQERGRPRPGFEDFLFLSRLRKRFGRTGLWKVLRSIFDRAAEGFPRLKQKRIVPHSIRHTTAVHMLQAGIDINVIKAWLGHSSVETTSNYLDLDLAKKREALEKFVRLESLELPAVDQTELPRDALDWLESL